MSSYALKKTKPQYLKAELLAMRALANLGSLGLKTTHATFSNLPMQGEKERNPLFKTKTRKLLNLGKENILEPRIFDDLISKNEARQIVNQYYQEPTITENISKYIETLSRPIGAFNPFNSERWRNRSFEINE
jgi:hypothetical protein